MLYYHRRVPKCSKRRLILIVLLYWSLTPILFCIWANSNKTMVWLHSSRTPYKHTAIMSSVGNVTSLFERSFTESVYQNQRKEKSRQNAITMAQTFITKDYDVEMVNLMTEALITKNSEIPLNENSLYQSTPGIIAEGSTIKNQDGDVKNDYRMDQSDAKYLLPSITRNQSFDDDRILLQLNHIPNGYMSATKAGRPIRRKTIYFYGGLTRWGMPTAEKYFSEHKCPVDQCDFINDSKTGRRADAIIFSNPGKLPYKLPWPRHSRKQIWALSMLESPYNTRKISSEYKNMFNWTMTYRRDSTISTPYQKIAIDHRKRIYYENRPDVNVASGKTKKVAWFVSNCARVRSGRMSYAKELMKYIDVDIFGSCGKKRCPKHNMSKCFDILKKDYKFYLAFENSKCKHYVTEKLLDNALRNNVVPIVMGASPEDYKNIAPPGSFIHVEDFESPKHLAEYLHEIDKNDDLFNKYFTWKSYASFIDAAPWCRFCAMLHEDNLPNTWYNDVNDWWNVKTTCIGSGKWPAK